MAFKSLDSIPPELLLQIGGYLTAALFATQSRGRSEGSHQVVPSYWNDRAAFNCYANLSSFARVSRTTYDVLNPVLYRLAARWMDLGLPSSPLSIGALVNKGELGLRVMDKLIDAGLVGDLLRDRQVASEYGIDAELETFQCEGRYYPSSVSVEVFPGRYQSLPVRPKSYFTSGRDRDSFLRPSRAIIPEDHLYFEPGGNLRSPWQSHQVRLLGVVDNFVCQKHQDSYNTRPKDSRFEEEFSLRENLPASCFRSPLHVAASSGNLKALKRLLDAGFNPNAWANGHCQCTELRPWYTRLPVYTRHRAKAELPSWNPLHSAICHGEFEAAKMLIAYGADVYCISKGAIHDSSSISAFHAAAGFGDIKLLDHLADLGLCSDPEVLVQDDGYRLTPLHWAVINGHLDTSAAWLLAHGVDIDTMKKTAVLGMDCSVLALALRYECFHDASRLIDMGATVTKMAETRGSHSSLHEACRRRSIYTGPPVDEVNNTRTYQPPPLVESQQRSRVDDRSEEARVDIVKKLIAEGCDLESRDSSYGQTAVGLAIEYCLPRTVACLLAAGASIDPKEVWEAFSKAYHFISPDGSGLQTLSVVVDHFRDQDAYFPDKVLDWLIGTQPETVWRDVQVAREAIRWMIAKGANSQPRQLASGTMEFNKLYVLAASLDFESAEILSRSQIGLSVDHVEELVQSLSLKFAQDDNIADLISALDVNRHSWKELTSPTLHKCLDALVRGWGSKELAFKQGQALLRFLEYAEDWFSSLPPDELFKLLETALEQLSWALSRYDKTRPKCLVPDPAIIHRLVQILCKAGAITGCRARPFLTLMSVCANSDLWAYDDVAPVINSLIQHGADVFESCDDHDHQETDDLPIQTVIVLNCYKFWHAILSASPDLLKRDGKIRAQLLHDAAWGLGEFLQGSQDAKSDAHAIQGTNSFLRIICSLLQNGADPTERDDKGKVPLQFILIAALKRPQNRIFGAPLDGHVLARKSLPLALRLLWHPSLAEHVIPAIEWRYGYEWNPGEDLRSMFVDDGRKGWWNAVRDLTVAECLRILLSGTIDESEFVPVNICTEQYEFADESRRIIAKSLAQTVRVWEDEDDGGRLKAEMLPMEWAGLGVDVGSG
ncbi:hypothetical protein MCOR25_009688 [Pyricularia grisea]|uniref:Uncharacterized protein n=1 Tax=Pyricularia grisea TaxID=148305 RepID=A0A6P8BG86_PYRGI|nr:uncharacterized protein PgNI_00154 [Pyricularia grisea]KAI6351894.1 hypothetical protein MCOR25_009688 [Pyricularia grisea]TLD15788.1 hypothetical protein PgNI_00154 [Pyricularia grisea]